MIVVFPYWDMPEVHDNLVKVMINSVRKSMPGIKIYQQSDLEMREVEGVDGVIRKEKTGDFIEHRYSMVQDLNEDAISLDYDLVVQKDLRHVFNEDFDLCFTFNPKVRDWMKLNSGVMFTRPSGKSFWSEVLKEYQPIKDGWGGGQLAKLRAASKSKLNIKYLTTEYNFTPKTFDENTDDKFVVHYKGDRKHWMAHKYLGGV